MRRFDKKKNIQKVNLLLEERRIQEPLLLEITDLFSSTSLKNDMALISEATKLLATGRDAEFMTLIYEAFDIRGALSQQCVLSFSNANTKLEGKAVTFSLPAGWTCPFAKSCLKKVHRHRKIDPEKVGTSHISKRTGAKVPYKGDVAVEKGEDAEFDCYAANQEMQYDAVRANRWHNYDLLKDAGSSDEQAKLIQRSLKYHWEQDGYIPKVRIHESGDFYNGDYLKAWIMVAKAMPDVLFYAYTKSIPFFKKLEKEVAELDNFIITFSEGGHRDRDLDSVDIKQAKVFERPEDILEAGLLVDLDDTLAQQKGGKEKNFALLVHGTQKAGEMSKNKARNETFMAYWKFRKKMNEVFGLPQDHMMTNEEAKDGIAQIDKLLTNTPKDVSKADLKFYRKLLRYVIKYNNYNFDEELINILPPKYRP